MRTPEAFIARMRLEMSAKANNDTMLPHISPMEWLAWLEYQAALLRESIRLEELK